MGGDYSNYAAVLATQNRICRLRASHRAAFDVVGNSARLQKDCRRDRNLVKIGGNGLREARHRTATEQKMNDSDVKDSLVSCQTSQGAEVRATLLRLTRYAAVIEIYNPDQVLQTSEVLQDFQIILSDRTVYSGRAVVRNVVGTGLITVCEVALEDTAWQNVEFTLEAVRNGKLREQFVGFMEQWQKLYRVLPEYKVIIADMQSYFSSLQLWADQVELSIRTSPSQDRTQLEQEVTEDLAVPVVPCVNALFEKFELVAQEIEEGLLPAHRHYMRRQLHPLVLCSPFAYRTFHKPLGYAGDYEMVNMIVRNRPEGASLFAKIVNTWFLRQPPAQAHRNRVAYLAEQLQGETLRASRTGQAARMFSVACGPAQEVQLFLNQTPISDSARITLLDFNDETLRYARSTLGTAIERHSRRTSIEYVRKSVQQLLKESTRVSRRPEELYDFVYCAGLFDYLSDQICQRLTSILYEWVAPGGLLVVTNVEPSNPLRHGMEHLLDWHLIYRTAAQMRALAPPQAPEDASTVRAEATTANLFLEVRKPDHA